MLLEVQLWNSMAVLHGGGGGDGDGGGGGGGGDGVSQEVHPSAMMSPRSLVNGCTLAQ